NAVLAAVTNRPFTFTWSDPPLGDHPLLVRATRTTGEVEMTAPTVISVRPGNDDFVARRRISGTSGSVRGNDLNGTFESREPVWSLAQSQRSAWWTWTAPTNGFTTISFGGTNFPTTMSVFAGNSLSNLIQIAASDSGFLIFRTVGGVEYQIAVDGRFG